MPGDNLFCHDYQPLPVIIRGLRLLGVMFPSYVSYIKVDKYFEGREKPALRAGLPDFSTPRKMIAVTSGLHDHEWISATAVKHLACTLITSFGKDCMIIKLRGNFEIVSIPVIKPDGFMYTWKTDRQWHRSRQPTRLRFCRGMDLDHAFRFKWYESLTQTDSCSESYGGGQEAFQAVEAMQLATWARHDTLNEADHVVFLDLHYCSQQFLFPSFAFE